MKIIDVCVGIIIDSNQNILITRRASKDHFAGGWEFPGGKIEPGETVFTALVRELKEELNISILVKKHCIELIHHYENLSVRIIAFYCDILYGKPKLSVHDELKWVKKEELLSYELLAADIPIAQKIIEDLKNA